MKVSVIIPAYNEEGVIRFCLESLQKQTYKDFEVIVIDDGSTDSTLEVVKGSGVKLLDQPHLGAGAARNLGAKVATGRILVFVDADMTFHPSFIKELVSSINNGKAIGTFSKEEYVANKDNVWSKCWNVNKKLPFNRMHPKNYPSSQPVFRAILKKEFDKIGGFSSIGYIDDYTLSEKLGVYAVAAKGAVFYHQNPGSLKEIFSQARWIGKSEYKRRKIKNEKLMKLIAIIRYSFPFTILNGIFNSVRFRIPQYLIFKIIYDFGVETSLLKSIRGEQQYR